MRLLYTSAVASIVPAVLPRSYAELEEELALFSRLPTIARVQIDAVDGRFASPASWPYAPGDDLSGLRRSGGMLPYLDALEYEIDLMCLDAETVAGDWLALGASRLTFHAESLFDISRFLAVVQNRYGDEEGGVASLVSFGLALGIESDVALLEQHLGSIDYVQFMGIDSIGKQGQPFDARVLERVRSFHAAHPEVPVQVDGGVSVERAQELAAAGVSDLVIGSAILKASDPAAAVAAFAAALGGAYATGKLNKI